MTWPPGPPARMIPGPPALTIWPPGCSMTTCWGAPVGSTPTGTTMFTMFTNCPFELTTCPLLTELIICPLELMVLTKCPLLTELMRCPLGLAELMS